MLTDITGFSTAGASVLLLVFGASAVPGNVLGARLATARGWEWMVRCALVALVAILIAVAVLMPYRVPMGMLLFVWGLVLFGVSPALQTGMLATAQKWAPQAAAFTSALNISAYNLGITLGETLGALLVEQGRMPMTPWAGVAMAMAAQLPLAWLLRKHLSSAPLPGVERDA